MSNYLKQLKGHIKNNYIKYKIDDTNNKKVLQFIWDGHSEKTSIDQIDSKVQVNLEERQEIVNNEKWSRLAHLCRRVHWEHMSSLSEISSLNPICMWTRMTREEGCKFAYL